jgi:hypothetical protein
MLAAWYEFSTRAWVVTRSPGKVRMKPFVFAMVAVLSMTASVHAQSPAEVIEQAVAKSPLRFSGQATLIKWKPDHTYDIIRQGDNKLVCYDRSDERDRSPFAAQCTNLANLPREAQNRKFRFETKNNAEENARIAAAEKDGTRVKPEYGSLWLRMDGRDKDNAMLHVPTRPG